MHTHRFLAPGIALTLSIAAGAAGQGIVYPIADLDVQLKGVRCVPPHNVWVGTRGSDPSLQEIDMMSGAIAPLHVGLPLSSPGRILLPNGGPLGGDDFIVSDTNSEGTSSCCDGRIFRFDPATGMFTTIYEGDALAVVGDPFGLAWSPGGMWGGGLYASDFQGASDETPFIFHIEDDGSATTLLQDPDLWSIQDYVGDIAFSPLLEFDMYLYATVSSPGNGEVDGVWKITPDGRAMFFSNVSSPNTIAFAETCRGPRMLVLTNGQDLVSVQPDGTATQIVTDIDMGTSVGSAGLDVHGRGQVVVACGSKVSLIRLCGPDFDGDCMVGVDDLLILLGHWGTSSVGDYVDLTGDDRVDVIDLLELLGRWGDCPL